MHWLQPRRMVRSRRNARPAQTLHFDPKIGLPRDVQATTLSLQRVFIRVPVSCMSRKFLPFWFQFLVLVGR